MSLSNYHLALSKSASGMHTESLSWLMLAESNAKEAAHIASTFTFPPSSPFTQTSRLFWFRFTSSHVSLCSSERSRIEREFVSRPPLHLPVLEPSAPKGTQSLVSAILIQDLFRDSRAQKAIGRDIFADLIPLVVHERARVFSEMESNLVRGEIEKAARAEDEVKRSLLEDLVKEKLQEVKSITRENLDLGTDISHEIQDWRTEIVGAETQEGVEKRLAELDLSRLYSKQYLVSIKRLLEIEGTEYSRLKTRYGPRWTQDPPLKEQDSFQESLKPLLKAFEGATSSDKQVATLWNSIREVIKSLVGHESFKVLELIDRKDASEAEDFVRDFEEKMVTLDQIGRERRGVIRDLKDEVPCLCIPVVTPTLNTFPTGSS